MLFTILAVMCDSNIFIVTSVSGQRLYFVIVYFTNACNVNSADTFGLALVFSGMYIIFIYKNLLLSAQQTS